MLSVGRWDRRVVHGRIIGVSAGAGEIEKSWDAIGQLFPEGASPERQIAISV